MRAAATVLVLVLGACGGDDGGGVEPDPDAGPGDEVEPGCVAFGFCDVEPFGEPVHYFDVWGAADDAVWVVGARGAVRFFDGASWSSRDVGSADADLVAIDGSGPDDVWAVGGGGAVWRWDGQAWSRLDPGTSVDLFDVAVVGPDEVYVAGDQQTLLRWDGTGWSDMAAPTEAQSINAVGALASDRVVASDGFAIHEWNGTGWTSTTVPPGAAVTDLSVVDQTATVIVRSGIGGFIADRFEGGELSPVMNGDEPASALVVRAPDDVVVAGSSGMITRRLGTATTEVTHGRHRMSGLWLDSTGVAWAAGEYGTILRLEPGAADSEVIDAGDLHTMLAVLVRSATDVWMAGLGGKIVHYDGSSWSPVESGTGADLHALAAAGDSIWAAGDHGVVVEVGPGGPQRRDIETDAALRSIVADGDAGIWVAGGVFERWDGAAWTPVSSLFQFATDAFSPAPGEIWLSQTSGEVSRYVDGVREPLSLPTNNDVFSIWVSGDGDVLAGLYANRIYRHDGAEWSEESAPDSGTPGAVIDLWGTAPDDVFALGSELLHFDGSSWMETEVTGSPLATIHGADGQVWAVGWKQRFVHLER